MKKLKLIFLFTVVFIMTYSCSKENENESQVTEIENTQYLISIVSDRQKEVYTAFVGGKNLATGSTTNESNTATLRFTKTKFDDLSSLSSKTLDNPIKIDSIVGEYRTTGRLPTTIYKSSAFTLDNSTEEINAVNSKLLYSHIFHFWSNARPSMKVYDNGEVIGSGVSQTDPQGPEAGYTELVFFDNSNLTTIDSIIGTYSDQFLEFKTLDVQIGNEFYYVDPITGGDSHLFIPISDNQLGLGYLVVKLFRNGEPEKDFSVWAIDDDSTEHPWQGNNAWNTTINPDSNTTNMYIAQIYDETRSVELAFYDSSSYGNWLTVGEWQPFRITVEVNKGNNGVIEVSVN